MVGEVIAGKYVVHRLLGEGGMGAVYEAQHTSTGRKVALKVISKSRLLNDGGALPRFEREARAAGAIDSQHVASILDAGIDKDRGLPFLVLELLRGEDLKTRLARTGAIAPDAALRIAAQACMGLAKAHEIGIVHRDVKSANLFLAEREGGERVVKVLDFGIAKWEADRSDAGDPTLTETNALVGSPHYLSPEQALGQKDIDLRTDIWSLGVVLFEMLTGAVPHREHQALGRIIVAISKEPPPSVRVAAPWVSEPVAAVVARALKLDPKDRFPTATAMLEAIRALLPNGTALDDAMIVPATRDVAAPARSPSRKAIAIAAGAVAVLAVAAIGGRALLSSKSDKPVVTSDPEVMLLKGPATAAAPSPTPSAGAVASASASAHVPTPASPAAATAVAARTTAPTHKPATSVTPAPTPAPAASSTHLGTTEKY